MIKHTRILQICMAIVVTIYLEYGESFFNTVIMILTMCSIASFHESLKLNFKPPDHTKQKFELKKMKKEMELISVAQKHIDAYASEL